MEAKVDEYINNATKWQNELEQLRIIILACGLTEEFKWRVPCYTHQGKNIVLLNVLKQYCTMGFFKGALLNDSNGILFQQTENSQATRLIRFTNVQEIEKLKPIIQAYIYEAIEIEKAGLKIDFKKDTELVFPPELEHQLKINAAFKQAFEALTPGRQKGYNLYFSEPKNAKNREARVEKYIQQIINGKGLRDCTCGLSKKNAWLRWFAQVYEKIKSSLLCYFFANNDLNVEK